jgi:TonB family protein
MNYILSLLVAIALLVIPTYATLFQGFVVRDTIESDSAGVKEEALGGGEEQSDDDTATAGDAGHSTEVASVFEGSSEPLGTYPVVDLATPEMKYFPYFARLKRQVEAAWQYPLESRLKGEEGDLTLVAAISQWGALKGVRIIKSSGYARLDEEAARAVASAAPFPRLPGEWGVDGVQIRLNFSYVLDKWWRAGGDQRASSGVEAPSFEDIRLEILGRLEKHAALSRVEIGGD